MNIFRTKSSQVPGPAEALPGRDEAMPAPDRHVVLGTPLLPPFPEGVEYTLFGMGCFWGAEKLFWQLPGVYTTAVGYAGGTPRTRRTARSAAGGPGHAEVVLVAFDPAELPLDELLSMFWEEHDPTQGMRQGNDVGTQYRSAIYYTTPEQGETAARRATRTRRRSREPPRAITTEIAEAGPFYFAEEYHQQYLQKNPNGYCGLAGTGVSCPIGVGVAAD